MKKAKKVYAAYNGAPYKLRDVNSYDSDINSPNYGEVTGKVGEVWSVYTQFTPDVDINCQPPITKGKSDTTHIKYLRSGGIHFNDKAWVEKHVGMPVQEHK
jgi:hypothetical protein